MQVKAASVLLRLLLFGSFFDRGLDIRGIDGYNNGKQKDKEGGKMKAVLMKWFGKCGASAAEWSYRKVTMRIGVVLLVFLLLFDRLWEVFDLVSDLVGLFMTEDGAYAVKDVLDSMAYLFSFLLPGLLFVAITPKRERVPMLLSPVFPRGSGWLVLLGITVISTMATLNAQIVSIFGYGKFSSEVLWETSTMADYEGVLLFISTAIVPAFCEEFLFRGIICNSLRPYGKTVAILGSALLFGIMHHNVGQLFYTTMAGIVLAVVYLETKSIWLPIFVHMFNNMSSVVIDIVTDRLDTTSANRVLAMVEALVIGLGILSLVALIRRGERARAAGERENNNLMSGRWNEEVFADRALSSGSLVRYFFSPTVVAFIVISIGQMLRLLYYAIRYVYH
jgi:membrane protease YdiL (CAAX protease family)